MSTVMNLIGFAKIILYFNDLWFDWVYHEERQCNLLILIRPKFIEDKSHKKNRNSTIL